MRILVLEDEDEVFDQIAHALSVIEDLHMVREIEGELAYQRILGQEFDCLVLDRIVVGLDGLSVLERARARDIETPALVLTGLSDPSRRTEGLDRGADDYLAKPFVSEELVARVRALTRRAHRMAHPLIRRHGKLELATRNQQASWAGVSVDLSPKEFDILLVLADHQPDIVSQEMLWRAVWPEMSNLPVQRSSLDVRISSLRAKLRARAELELVETIKNKGYRLTVPAGPIDGAA